MKSFSKSPVQAPEQTSEEDTHGHIICAILPLALMLSLVFILLWRDGGGFAADKSILSLTSWREVLTKAENGIWILFVASFFAYLSSVLLTLIFAKQKIKTIFDAFYAGLRSSLLPILILILAWSLKLVCDDLKTGEYIVSLLSGRFDGQWLPMAIFVISALTAFSTGTSWGTMAILIPTVTPLAVSFAGGEYGMYVALCLAAILDGAIMGDHCSPISDTTIMSSIATECDLLNHVKTQLPYSLLVGMLALIFGYLPAGFSFPLPYTVGLSLVFIVSLFAVLKKWPRKRSQTL